MVLVIDNYDSFTYNLVQYLGELGESPVVRRNDAITVEEVGEILTVTPRGIAKLNGGTRYLFPNEDGTVRSFAFDDLMRGYADTNKEGMHDTKGMLLMYGPGIERGLFIENTNDLDIAPTLLALMGIPVPDVMKGRVLSEAWGERRSAPARPAAEQSSVTAPA